MQPEPEGRCGEAVADDLVGRLCVVGLADGRVLVKPVLDADVAWTAKVKGMTPG